MRAVRHLGCSSRLLAALAVPIGVTTLGVGIQAAAFGRPPHDALIATSAIRDLLRFGVMRATEDIGGKRLQSTCIEGSFRVFHHSRPEPGALVLLSNGVKLYNLNRGIRQLGRRGTVSRIDHAYFLLAACPRFTSDRITNDLVSSHRVDADPSRVDGASTLELRFGLRTKPIDLFVNRRTDWPLAMQLSGFPARAWSDLNPGGGAQALARVRRAFGLLVKKKPNV